VSDLKGLARCSSFRAVLESAMLDELERLEEGFETTIVENRAEIRPKSFDRELVRVELHLASLRIEGRLRREHRHLLIALSNLIKCIRVHFDAAVGYLPYLDAQFRDTDVLLEVRAALIDL